MSDGPPDARAEEALLLADIGHYEEKFRWNESIGETRLNYFVSLVGAGVAGLVALHTAESDWAGSQLTGVTLAVLLVLSSFGVITYFRLLRRNHVTDEYKQTLDTLRARYVRLTGIDRYCVPVELTSRWHDFFRGGLAQTTGAITASLVGAAAFFLTADRNVLVQLAVTLGCGFVVFVVSLVGARRSKTEVVSRQQG